MIRVCFQRVKLHELGDAVVLNADSGQIETPFDDINSLPNEVRDSLKRGLKKDSLIGDAVSRFGLLVIFSSPSGKLAPKRLFMLLSYIERSGQISQVFPSFIFSRAFLCAVVQLIGGYRDALKLRQVRSHLV